MKRIYPLALTGALLLASLPQQSFAVDVEDAALAAGYTAVGAGATYSLIRTNSKLHQSWEKALPNEMKEFDLAQKAYDKESAESSRAASQLHDTNDKYIKARDGYTYQTSRIEAQPQWVQVEIHDEHDRVIGHKSEFQMVNVTVYDTHHVAPVPSEARRLKPEVDRLAKIAGKEAAEELSAREVLENKTKVLASAKENFLNTPNAKGWGRNPAAGLANGEDAVRSQIKRLRKTRLVGAAALSVAAVTAVTDLALHATNRGGLIESAGFAQKKPLRTNFRRHYDHSGRTTDTPLPDTYMSDGY